MKRLMSKNWLAWIIAVAGTLAVSPAWAELKIGVVDYGKLVEESPQAKAAWKPSAPNSRRGSVTCRTSSRR